LARCTAVAVIRNISPVYLKSARSMKLSHWQTIMTVLFPACLPEIVSGLWIGFAVTLLGVLLAEMFASKQGFGFLIINAMSLLQTEEMIAVAVLLFALCSLRQRTSLVDGASAASPGVKSSHELDEGPNRASRARPGVAQCRA
jgi:ABC-type nitrate/sulfonate/bicarbonate transport system permease component